MASGTRVDQRTDTYAPLVPMVRPGDQVIDLMSQNGKRIDSLTPDQAVMMAEDLLRYAREIRLSIQRARPT